MLGCLYATLENLLTSDSSEDTDDLPVTDTNKKVKLLFVAMYTCQYYAARRLIIQVVVIMSMPVNYFGIFREKKEAHQQV